MANLFWPLMMLFLGLGLLALELVIPSAGVLGILACLTLLAAVGSGFAMGGLAVGTLFMTLTVVLIPLVLLGGLKMWQKTSLGRRLLMEPPDEATVLPAGRLQAREWIGQRGVALSPLLPAGAVRIGERTLDAITEGLSVEKADRVIVVAVRDNRLVVRQDDSPVEPEADTASATVDLAGLQERAIPYSSTGAESVRSESKTSPRPNLDLDVPDPFDDSLP